MIQHCLKVAGEPVTINVVEHPDDLPGFREFVRKNLRCLAVDTETTGLEMYAPGFKVRLVQFGNTREAWVLPVELGGVFVEDALKAIKALGKLVFHNGVFDLQVIDKHFGLAMEELWPRTTDTQILAKLIDPRAPEKGGIGNSLEDVTRHYVDPVIADNVKTLMARLAKLYKTTKAKIFEKIDLFHPEYNIYAGMDVILAARLLSIQLSKVPDSARSLISYEHKVSEVCSYMSRQGFLLDVDYAEELSERLLGEEEHWSEIALQYGVENVNSGDQVAAGLIEAGVKLTARTDSGKYKVDKAVLGPLVESGNQLALAVQEAKKAGKWRSTWVDKFLATRDENDRCHASINTLQARTGRMSITGIPAQTLPASDSMIRRCFVADPGHLIASIDYKAQELRVLAALSQDPTMMRAFVNGDDLHLITAQAAFGDHICKDDPERKYGKVGNFSKVFGGGAGTIAEQLGIPVQVAKEIVQGFDRAYPRIAVYSNKLQSLARRQGYVVTGSGRVLPVDKDRPYSALNYMVQSTARDVTCRALIRLHEAGFTPYMRLVIHDEFLLSVPADKAEWGALEVARIAKEVMNNVVIDTDADVYGTSWGDGYT